MTFELFKSLFRLTLRDPRQGGREVIALNWPIQSLWLLLMLMAVLLSLLVSGLFHASPMPPDEMGALIQMSPAYHSPLLFAVINWGQSVITVFVLTWISRAFGGKGELGDMLAVMIWLQVMTLVMAVALFLFSLALPLFGALLMIAAFFWGLWAMVALVDAAAGFNSMFTALGVCVLALVAFMIGMAFISGIIGGLVAGGV